MPVDDCRVSCLCYALRFVWNRFRAMINAAFNTDVAANSVSRRLLSIGGVPDRNQANVFWVLCKVHINVRI